MDKIEMLMTNGSAYLKDGHVFCHANCATSNVFDHPVSPHLKQSESDLLLWTPSTALGLKPVKCKQSPWGPGHPTVNCTRLL